MLAGVTILGLMTGCGSQSKEDENVANADAAAESSEMVYRTYFDEYGTAEDPFNFPVEDVFYVTGRGLTITGRVNAGTVKVGDEIDVIGMNHDTVRATVAEILIDRQEVEQATVGDVCGILLKDVEDGAVVYGMNAITPGAYQTVSELTATIDISAYEDGGSDVPIELNKGYAFCFYDYHNYVPGKITAIDGKSNDGLSIKPGTDGVKVTIQLDDDLVIRQDQKIEMLAGPDEGWVLGYGRVNELLDAKDASSAIPTVMDDMEIGDVNGAFNFPIGDVFTIKEQGMLITGRVKSGSVKVGDEIDIVGMGKETVHTKVIDITQNKQSLEEAKAGDNVGLLLADSLDWVRDDNVVEGMNAITPGAFTVTNQFTADVEMLSKEESGRSLPVSKGYAYPVKFDASVKISGKIVEINGDESKLDLATGKSGTLTIQLDQEVLLEEGQTFELMDESKEGRVIGKGTVRSFEAE